MIPSFLRTQSRRIRPRYFDDSEADSYGPAFVPRMDEGAPVAASPGVPPAIEPRFDPSVVPAEVPGLPGGSWAPRAPQVTTDLKGYVHQTGAPIGPSRDLGALPAGYIDPNGGAIGIDPGINPHPLDTYDQMGVAHASRLPVDQAAEAELGPEPKRGRWGNLALIAAGALAGMQGQQLPEEITNYGRHRIYQAELSRKQADIADRYKSEDERMLEPERARQARNQAELGNLQLEQARAQIDYTNRRNRGELTPDQIADNRRQVLSLGAPVTAEDARLLSLPPEWIGKPIPGQGPKDRAINPQFHDVKNPDQSTSVFTVGPDGKLYPAEYGTGGNVVNAAPRRADPTTRPRAKSTFVASYGTSDEGKSVYSKTYSDALAGAVDPGLDIEATPAAIDGELSRLQTRIRALDDAGRAGPDIPGDVAGMDPEDAKKEQNQLRKRYAGLANAKHRADVEARKSVDAAAAQKFYETYTGENEQGEAPDNESAESGGYSAYSKADFDRTAAQHGIRPGSAQYNQAYQQFLAGGGRAQ